MLQDVRLKYSCRIIVGVVFILSAILKFISVDSFELYVYGFDWFNLAVSSYLARLLLFAEMLVGLCLVSGVYAKLAVRGAAVMLSAFSIFLIYLIISGNNGNCHCFGETFDLNPWQSLLKNLLLGILLYFAWNGDDWFTNLKNYILPSLIVASVVFAFVLKAPYGFGKEKEIPFDQEKFELFSKQHPAVKGEGKRVVAFFSTYCKHCKSAMRKLDIVLRQHPFPKDRVQWYVWGNEPSLRKFLSETEIEVMPYEVVKGPLMLGVSGGSVPLILLLEDGEVKGKLSNSRFDEKLIVEFVNDK